ncbi:MAG TPA: PAS domain S-box protein [Candidatus Sulfotelmatobacter sp.]|jgi:PAS domain S-box-containing protein|nr:PAS domain S-box protein [Candidatus Sulfotelmatobacter sp.]
MGSLSILVVDDHAAVRNRIRDLLSQRPGWFVCGEAADGVEAIEKAKEFHPDVAIVDISMPRLDGLAATRVLRQEVPDCEVIIVSQNDPTLVRKSALEAGATAFVDKSKMANELVAAIEAQQPMTRREPTGTERRLADVELERNRLRELIMQAPAAIGLLSGPELRWTLVNPEYIRVAGRKRAEDFLGKTLLESLPELEGQPFFEPLDTAYRTGIPYIATGAKAVLNRAATGQNDEAYFNFVYQPIRNLEGNVEGILVHAVEVTGQVQEEKEREKRERASGLLAAIVDSSDDAIISKTLEGVITSWNKGAERLFGYTPDEAVGQHITLIIPEDRQNEEANILERLKRGERIDHFETLRQRRDGSLISLSLTISPVKDDAGRIVGASKVARNVTEQRQIELALAERGRLLDLSNDAIIVRDSADRITYWNQSACELYGYTREEAMGQVCHHLLQTVFPEPPDRIAEHLRREIRWAGELIHRRKDGSKIVVASRWALDKDEHGQWKSVLETNNDITQQKESDRALRESEERLRVLSNSLEVQVRDRTEELERRNAEVLQQSEQLRELSIRLLRTQDEERRHIARELHDSAGQIVSALGMNLASMTQHVKKNPALAGTLEDTQNLVQQLNKEIRTTSYLLHPPLLDENGLPQAIQWYMQGLMERGDLKIDLDISEDFGRLPADLELAVFRIVQESLTNIHRHSGSKTASIRLFRAEDKVLLQIEDQGKGISADKLIAIKAQRTGVGMTGMRERIRHFKGGMDIQSNGTGATIVVTIPLPTESKPASETFVH